MKILWFSPTPATAEEYFNTEMTEGGWIKSLERELRSEIELSIAFYHPCHHAPFPFKNTIYYPIKKKSDKFGRKIIKEVFGLLESKKDIKSFLQIINIVKPDLIHIHGSEFQFGLIQEFTTIPIVLSIQGNINAYTLKFFSGISALNVIKYTSIKSHILFKSNLIAYIRFKRQARREKEIFRLINNYIGRTEWDRRICSVLASNSNYYHNDEILRDVFYHNEWNGRQNEVDFHVFTTTGKAVYKGLETIICCASILDDIGFNFCWHIAGVKYNDEIVKLAIKSSKSRLSKNLVFEGKLHSEKLVDKLLDSNVYVSPSHIENSPNSLCEAMILGLPCIATFAGGTSSLLLDGIEGILIQDGDPFSMAGAIVELSINKEMAKSYGKQARKRALKRHDQIKIVNDLVNIYKSILAEHK